MTLFEANALVCLTCDKTNEPDALECAKCGGENLDLAQVDPCKKGDDCEAPNHDYGTGNHVRRLG